LPLQQQLALLLEELKRLTNLAAQSPQEKEKRKGAIAILIAFTHHFL
jgi:hypothetical protein